ncbi:MAG: C10 family peptidase [Tannerella sp.]|nr:C10 family peptidase [Tannerella sp.]
MKTKLFFLLTFSLLLLFTGCNGDNNQFEIDSREETSAWYVISSVEAKVEALQFLNTNLVGTKSASGRETKDISDREIEVQSVWRSLTFSNAASGTISTRSAYTEEIPVYIFSLKESDSKNAGFIVSVGDKRVLNRVIAFSDKEEWDMSEIPEFEAIFWDNVDNYLINTLSESGVDMCDTYDYIVTEEEETYVSDFLLKWGQTVSPYNDSVPVCTSTGLNMPTGCVAVAMGQIMAYHGKPLSGSYIHPRYNRTVNAQYDWFKMRGQLSAEYLTSVEGRSGVANILAEAGYKVNMDYDCGGSGAYPPNAVSGFQQMSFSCSSLTTFNLNYILNDINSERPVYIRGDNGVYGHAWIIEGYKKYIYNTYYGRDCPYGGGESIPPTLIGSSSEYYLYFNLGWFGSSNGFYSSTVFSGWPFATNSPQIIYNIQYNS